MAQGTQKSTQSETFSLIRFAEYRPSTFTADFTIEIPTLAQFITDETFQPVNIVVWLEMTSLMMRNLHEICVRLEELLSTTIECGKELFRSFPPMKETFNLTIHLLQFNTKSISLTESVFKRSVDDITSLLFKGLGRDIEKWVTNQYRVIEINQDYDLTRWNLQVSLKYVNDSIKSQPATNVQNVNLLFFSCWHTEGPFEELYQTVEAFEQEFVSWIYLFTVSPINSMTVGLADLLKINYFDLLVEEKQLVNQQQKWKNAVLTLLEPILEVHLQPTILGTNYSIATNLPFFQKPKNKQNGFIVYNLQSQRYPIRINLLFNLPVVDKQAGIQEYNPKVLEKIELHLRRSTGKEFKNDIITEGITYRLPPSETKYQPERELNARMRRAQRLKLKLASIIEYQIERSAQIKKMIVEPSFLEQFVDEELVKESIIDIRIAFEIIDYLQEQELLLAELPPVSKKFEPPKNGNTLI